VASSYISISLVEGIVSFSPSFSSSSFDLEDFAFPLPDDCAVAFVFLYSFMKSFSSFSFEILDADDFFFLAEVFEGLVELFLGVVCLVSNVLTAVAYFGHTRSFFSAPLEIEEEDGKEEEEEDEEEEGEEEEGKEKNLGQGTSEPGGPEENEEKKSVACFPKKEEGEEGGEEGEGGGPTKLYP
jgi:hypothetical protein